MNGSCCQWEGLPDKSCSISLSPGRCQGWLSTKTLHSSQWPALRLLGFQSSTLKTHPWFIMYSVCTIQRGRKLGEDRGLCSDSPIFTLISCFLNIICWKQYPFSTGLPLPFSQRSVGCIYVDLFMVSFSQSIGFSTLCQCHVVRILVWLFVLFKSGTVGSPTLYPSVFRWFFWTLTFQNSLKISHKITI